MWCVGHRARPNPSRYLQSRRGRRNVPLHRLIWIATRGPIPPGFVIHHRNENKWDNRPGNLALMSAADHMSLHSRGRQLSTAARRRIAEGTRRSWQTRRRRGLCSVEGCGRPHSAKGFCNMHYLRQYLAGRLCSIVGCWRRYRANGLCRFHLSATS
jgi:hypothetical protein